jgi:hypothetical protein
MRIESCSGVQQLALGNQQVRRWQFVRDKNFAPVNLNTLFQKCSIRVRREKLND